VHRHRAEDGDQQRRHERTVERDQRERPTPGERPARLALFAFQADERADPERQREVTDHLDERRG